MQDARGLSVSIEDAETIELYERSVAKFQSYFGDPMEQLDDALARSPNFIVGHLLRAGLLYTASERRYVAEANDSVNAAEALASQANDRERRVTQAMRRLVSGCWREACLGFDDVLRDYPRDIVTLQLAHLMDFYRGDALNLRNRPMRVLPAWSSQVTGYPYLLGMLAFGLEECNQYDLAASFAEQSLAIQPSDVWAVHAQAHVLEMRGEVAEGARFLEQREADWAPDNGFAFHNWWHLGLFHLEQGNHSRVLEILDQKITAEAGDMSLALVDVTAMLWRLHLVGVDVADRAAQVADVWGTRLEEEAGHYPFNDFHAALAFALADRTDSLAEVEAGLVREAAESESDTASMCRNVGLPLVRGLRAYHEGRFSVAANTMMQVRDIAHQFGGSHAQRDVISLSIIDAAHRGGDDGLCSHLLNERKLMKPNGQLATQIVDRAA